MGAVECAVSIYSSREEKDVLLRTVACALESAAPFESVVDVIVNGNAALASAIAAEPALAALRPHHVGLRIWEAAFGDKAHAWNEYVHALAPVARTYVFIDGYAQVDASAIAHLTSALWAHDDALAVTGVPRKGASARRYAVDLRLRGGLHGNLYGLKDTAVAELKRIAFRLPLAIYRTDPTLAAALSFGLNLFPREWRPKHRIRVECAASWDMPERHWWRPADLHSHFRRVMRQGQGILENAAVGDLFANRRRPFESLPRTAPELVLNWIRDEPEAAQAILAAHWRARAALESLKEPRNWLLSEQPAVLKVELPHLP